MLRGRLLAGVLLALGIMLSSGVPALADGGGPQQPPVPQPKSTYQPPAPRPDLCFHNAGPSGQLRPKKAEDQKKTSGVPCI
jgi:hypothetical protein